MSSSRRGPDPVYMARAYARMRRNLAGVLTIAVTGTKGKTSTAEFIAQLMERRGLLTAVSTTESARIGHRSLEACDNGQQIYSFVARCRQAGVECLVIELCSSALEWNLHHGFPIDAAVLTNIGTDHIRYHGNRRNYIAVKMRMFRDLLRFAKRPHPIAILNGDDREWLAFRNCLPDGVTAWSYAMHAPAGRRVRNWISARGIKHRGDGTHFVLHGLETSPLACRTALHGAFNVANVLAAVGCVSALVGDPRQAVADARTLIPPGGRFELVVPPSASRPAVVVDFAHTPESMESALAGARAFAPGGEIYAVFGCGGETYKRKRPLMGAATASGADAIILTSDNPRRENPRAIANDILRGMPRAARGKVRVELDRGRAIHLAVSEARGGDVVLILGKGTETTQEIGRKMCAFSDARCARLALAARGGTRDPLSLSALSAILLNEKGETLYARNADEPRPPASLAKLMTLYLACADLAAGRIRGNETVAITGYAALTPHPGLPARAGDRLPLRVLLEALAVHSSNLAATALAEHLGANGTEHSFVQRMNERARELGLGATYFATPHGLPHRQQKSSARDLARLVLRLATDYPAAKQILRRETFCFRGRVYRRPGSLFRDPGGIEALKTGFTTASGDNLAVTAKVGRRGRFHLVLLDATSRAAAFRDARRLLRFAAS